MIPQVMSSCAEWRWMLKSTGDVFSVPDNR